MENRENMGQKYEVAYTLIIGKQSVKKTEDTKGNIKVTAHKKPVGYVLRDVETGEMIAVDHSGAVEKEIKHGITNAMTVVSTSQKDGIEIKTLYIKAKAGCTPLQDPEYVVDPERFLPSNKDIKVTKELAESLVRKTPRRGRGKSSEPKYTKEQLLGMVETQRKQLNEQYEK